MRHFVSQVAVNQAVLAAYLACALIWGTTWYAIRVCIGEGGFEALLRSQLSD